jgi:hypothetical protein
MFQGDFEEYVRKRNEEFRELSEWANKFVKECEEYFAEHRDEFPEIEIIFKEA